MCGRPWEASCRQAKGTPASEPVVLTTALLGEIKQGTPSIGPGGQSLVLIPKAANSGGFWMWICYVPWNHPAGWRKILQDGPQPQRAYREVKAVESHQGPG